MKPAAFDYIAPDSLDAALAAVNEYGYDAKLLAGGQSLVPMMNFRLAQPAVIVDLNGLSELDTIGRGDSGALRLGAMVRQRRLERDPLVAEIAPLLYEAMPHVAHPQIRNRGTLGGSLAHADPAAELPVVMVALDGRFRLQRAGGERWIEARDFFTGIFATDLAAEEIVVEVEMPPLPPRTGVAFVEMARRHGDYALAGGAALVSLSEDGTCTKARLVYLNAGEVPVVAEQAAALLAGRPLSERIIEEAAALVAEQEVEPMTDIHATADFKRHLVKVLTARALKQALARAGNG